jgi:hypothetical protein
MPVAAPISAAVPVLTVKDWPRASSAAASGVPRNAASVWVGSLLRWLSRGAATALGSVIPKSMRLSRICATVVMIDAPPGEPRARNGRPLRRTMVGAIDERGRLPPCTTLAPVLTPPGVLGSVLVVRLKSVISLLSRKP